ncbi:MAG: hypothetical protein HY872_06405 [Chloroflexi bacterium]|nr:hypothetical protein [Chloroflexota bacterium]
MPTTIAALVIVLFAILPGIPAYEIYRMFFGADWRATDWEKIVGIIGFSAGGLIIYTIVSSVISLPPPVYVIPATFDSASFGISSLLPIAVSYLGHSIASITVAILTILGIRLVTKWTPTTPYPAAWDDFIRVDVQKHWVVVRLTNGEAYAGTLRYVDTSVNQAERDLVLAEPAQFIEIEKNYKVIPYQQLFLPAALVSSVAVVYDPDVDKRISKVGSTLFLEEKTDA